MINQGSSISSCLAYDSGGGVTVLNGPLEMEDVSVSNNAVNALVVLGGGVYVQVSREWGRE